MKIQVLNREQWEQLPYEELYKYRSTLYSLYFQALKEFEDANPEPLKRGGKSQTEWKKLTPAEREPLAAAYVAWIADRKAYVNLQAPEFEEVSEKLNTMYRAIPNTEKYAKPIALLKEAQSVAISNVHKERIEQYIADLSSQNERIDRGDIVAYKLPQLWYMGAKQYVTGLIKKLGGKRYHKSGNTVAGSVYYELPNTDKVRISDHELPATEQREYNRSVGIGGNWINLVLDEPKPFAEVKQDVLEAIEFKIGKTSNIAQHYKSEQEQILKKAQEIAMNEKMENGGFINMETPDLFSQNLTKFATGGKVDEDETKSEDALGTTWEQVPMFNKYASPVKPVKYELTPNDKGLQKILGKIVSNDELRPAFMGINFDANGVAATDAQKLVFIPTTKLAKKDYGIYDGAQKIEQRYPDYMAVIEAKKNKHRLTVDILALKTFAEVALDFVNEAIQTIKLKRSENKAVAFRGKFLIEVIDLWMMLGHTEVDFLFQDDSSKQVIIVPKNGVPIKDITVLLMPINFYEEGHLKYLGQDDLDSGYELTSTYDLSTNLVVDVESGKTYKIDTTYTKSEQVLFGGAVDAAMFRALRDKFSKNATIDALTYVLVSEDNELFATSLESAVFVSQVVEKQGIYRFGKRGLLPLPSSYDGISYIEETLTNFYAKYIRNESPVLSTINTADLENVLPLMAEARNKDQMARTGQGIDFLFEGEDKVVVQATNSYLLAVNDLPSKNSNGDVEGLQLLDEVLSSFIGFANGATCTISTTSLKNNLGYGETPNPCFTFLGLKIIDASSGDKKIPADQILPKKIETTRLLKISAADVLSVIKAAKAKFKGLVSNIDFTDFPDQDGKIKITAFASDKYTETFSEAASLISNGYIIESKSNNLDRNNFVLLMKGFEHKKVQGLSVGFIAINTLLTTYPKGEITLYDTEKEIMFAESSEMPILSGKLDALETKVKTTKTGKSDEESIALAMDIELALIEIELEITTKMENGGMVNEMLLYVSFPNKTDYEKAKDFFANESGFSAQNEIDEFKSIGFVVSSQEDADSTEIEITKELNKAGFDNYRFELEDSFEQFKNGGKMDNNMKNPELFAMGGSPNSEPTEISEQTLSEIRSQLKKSGLVIDNEYTNEDNDHIDYYFDVDSERFEGREPQLKALVKSIASRHELEYGFDLNRDNLFFFYKDAELFAEGGMVNEDVFASGSVKSPDGIILGKVQYNPYWKKYQVKIDGVIYGEHDYVVDAVQELRHFGFENVKIMEKGGAVEFEWNTYSYSLKPQATRENAEEKLAEFKRNNPEARNFRIEEVPYSWGIDYRIVFEHERRKMEKGGSITKTKTAADFKVGTPANYHTRNDGEQAGEIVMRDGKKTISLYPNRNYGGRDRIVINPDKINWNHMESFADAAKRAGEPFMFAKGGAIKGKKAKLIIVNSSNPLSTQLQAITGDSWNSGDYSDISVGNFNIATHKPTGQKFVVYPKRVYEELSDAVKQDDITYLKNVEGIVLEGSKRAGEPFMFAEGGAIEGGKFTFMQDNPKGKARALGALAKYIRIDNAPATTRYQWLENEAKKTNPRKIKEVNGKFRLINDDGQFYDLDYKAEADYYNYLLGGGYSYSENLKDVAKEDEIIREQKAQKRETENIALWEREQKRQQESDKIKEEQIKATLTKTRAEREGTFLNPLYNELEELKSKRQTKQIIDDIKYIEGNISRFKDRLDYDYRVYPEIYQLVGDEIQPKHKYNVDDEVFIIPSNGAQIKTKIKALNENGFGSVTYEVEKMEGISNPYVGYESLRPTSRVNDTMQSSKLTSQEIEKFIAAQNTWFELEDATENRITYITRENGNMGNDTAGGADIAEARRLKKIIDAKFEQAETTIDTIDEWVNLTVKIKAPTKNIQPQQLIQAKQYGEEAFKRGALLTQAQDPKFMDMLKGRNPNETPSGEASTKELMNAWADGWFEAKNDAKASQMTPEPTAKEYKYAPTLRPLDIGTYPKENFVRLESDASNKFGAVAVYSAPLSLRDISHFDFFPVTEIEPFVGKEMYYEYAIGEKVKVSLDGDVVILTYDDGTGEGKYRMTAVNFLQGVQDGTYRLLENNQKSTSSICDDTPAGAMQFKKVNFIDDDSDYFYYVIREEGNKYIAVSCEKIEHWLESDEIERYEYYEEIIPMSEMREVGQAMVQELKNELAKMEDKNLDNSVQKMEKEILENIDKFKASKIGEYATKAASLLGDFLESKVVNDFSLLTKYFKLELMLPKTYRLGLSQFYDESYRTVENWAKNLNTNIWGLFPEEITQMPNIKQIEVKPDPEDKGLAQLLSPFVSKDELRTAMLGVYFDEYGITATDAHVMLHLNLKSENRGIYCITDDCLKKVESGELKGNQIDRRYPDYQAIIPMRNAISKIVKVDEILTFLSAMDKAQAYRNEKVKIVAFSADNMIFAYSNILSTKIFTAFKKLGYEEVEMLLDDSERRDSRACVIIPKGNKDRLSYDTDFGLLMPVIWDENYKYPVVSNLEKGTLYFDLDTHSVITHGAGEPISLIESTNNKKSVKTNANSNKAKVEATISTTMSQSDFEFFKGLDHVYENPFKLNRAIEELIKSKGMSSAASDYTTDEKMFIKKYSGMGGLEKFGAEGIGLLYEYFTPDEVVKKMWGLAYKHGYNNGRVLEPSCGIGSFLEYAPDKSNPVGYEINPYSAIIAKVLYPKTTIIEQPFETIFIKDNSSIKAKTAKLDKYDLVIGNPPYGNFNSKFAGMGEKQYTKAKNYVEYFMLRGLDLLNTDGLLIMIIGVEVAAGGTPFLQQGMTPTKEMIAERGDLVEAYRLPNGVFDRTDVLTDIVVIKKK